MFGTSKLKWIGTKNECCLDDDNIVFYYRDHTTDHYQCKVCEGLFLKA